MAAPSVESLSNAAVAAARPAQASKHSVNAGRDFKYYQLRATIEAIESIKQLFQKKLNLKDFPTDGKLKDDIEDLCRKERVFYEVVVKGICLAFIPPKDQKVQKALERLDLLGVFKQLCLEENIDGKKMDYKKLAESSRIIRHQAMITAHLYYQKILLDCPESLNPEYEKNRMWKGKLELLPDFNPEGREPSIKRIEVGGFVIEGDDKLDVDVSYCQTPDSGNWIGFHFKGGQRTNFQVPEDMRWTPSKERKKQQEKKV